MDRNTSVVEGGAARAHEAVDEAAARVSQTVAPTIDKVARGAHRTVDTVARAAVPAAEWLDEGRQRLLERQEELLADCRSYVRERPLVTIGVALLAGYIAGRLAR